MALTTKYIRQFAKGELSPDDEERFYTSLCQIARLVRLRYFAYLTPTERQDAQGVAVLAAFEKIQEDYVDFDSHDPMHFVFTVMRNAMTNFFRKYKNREIITDPEIFQVCCASRTFIDASLWEEVRFNYQKLCDKVPCVQRHDIVSFDEAMDRLSALDEGLIMHSIQMATHAHVSEVFIDDISSETFE